MTIYAQLIRPFLFACDAEKVHDAAICASSIAGACPPIRGLLKTLYGYTDSRLHTEVCGLPFASPLGLAAGYDKNGRAVRALAALGFGHVEVGSISAHSSNGNPRPRLWRLPEDRAIVVHYGLPNEGARAISRDLARVQLPVPLGLNIVKTNRGRGAAPDTDEAIVEDYCQSIRLLRDRADYLVLNLSCPNTEMGRDFFAEPGNVARLLAAADTVGVTKPLFLKVSPLGGDEALDRLLQEADPYPWVSGFVFNLSPGKPDTLRSDPHVYMSLPGAVSGKPIAAFINSRIRDLYARMDHQRYRIIGTGGVFTAEDAYEKIRLGASLVQLMTALIFEGPGVLKRINRGLVQLLQRDGFNGIAEAVGTAHTHGEIR